MRARRAGSRGRRGASNRHGLGSATLTDPSAMLRSRTMALTYIAGTVNRTGRRRRAVSVRFLVDTGAVYTELPENVWRGLGLRGDRVVEFTLADGTAIRRDVSECRIQVGGRSRSEEHTSELQSLTNLVC